MSGPTHTRDLFHSAHQPWALDWDGRVLPYTGRHSVPWKRDSKGDVIPKQIYKHTHCAHCGKALEEGFSVYGQDDLGRRFQEVQFFFPEVDDDSDPEPTEGPLEGWDDDPPVWRLVASRVDGRGMTAHSCLCSAACAQAWIEAVRTGSFVDIGWWCGEHADAYRPDLNDEEYEAWQDECYEGLGW